MENNKYYVPSIEEFRVGFEYEYLTVKDEWVKDVFGIEKPADWEQMPFDLINRIYESATEYVELRVKYLDREDIEELGFVLLKENEAAEFELSYEDELFYKKCNITENDKYLDVLFCFRQLIPNEGVHIVIYTKYNGWLKGYNKSIASFNGIIKNKSELKVLMNQLGISNGK
jgi:hypothetical protein